MGWSFRRGPLELASKRSFIRRCAGGSRTEGPYFTRESHGRPFARSLVLQGKFFRKRIEEGLPTLWLSPSAVEEGKLRSRRSSKGF